MEKKTSLCYDNWLNLGPLAQRYGSRVIYDSGLPREATVSVIIRDNSWALPQTFELNEIRCSLLSMPNPNKDLEDHTTWSLSTNGKFSISSMWNHLRTPFPKVEWVKSIWFPGHIPKCSFIAWIVIQQRLYTEDRLVLFGTKVVSCCSY